MTHECPSASAVQIHLNHSLPIDPVGVGLLVSDQSLGCFRDGLVEDVSHGLFVFDFLKRLWLDIDVGVK